MELLMALIRDVLGNAAILVGLVALVGLVIQKKSFVEVFTRTVKTIVGFLIFYIGAGAGVSALNNFQSLFSEGFNLQGVMPLAEALTAMAMTKLGTVTSLIMVFGFVVNLIVARFTPFKYIFLTGQHNLFFAALLAVVTSASGLSPVASVIVGSVILGFFAGFYPWLGRHGMRAITGSDEIGIGHYVTIGYALSSWIGSKVGKPEDSTEKLKLPGWLSIFRDYVASISITMIVIYYVAALAAGRAAVEQVAGGTYWLVFPLIQALTFSGAVYVIITGVRMFLGEIVPAFLGISSKIIPNAIPALDCPAVFPYAPTAVIIGFLSAYAAGLLSMAVFLALGVTVIIPVAIPYFFIGATAGVFGNATGGWKGAVAGAFIVGILIAVGPALIYPIMEQVGLSGTSFPETDFTAVGLPLYFILSLFR
jgi:PTS system ascorbate-specific IIC component